MNTYEPSSSGAHRYQKKGYVYAQQIINRNFVAKKKEGYQNGNAGDYLLQAPEGEQWTMDKETFDNTYELELLSRHTRMLDGILEYNEDDSSSIENFKSVRYLTHESMSCLTKCDSLLFDIFAFDKTSSHHSLSSLATFLFQRRGLLNEFNIDPKVFALFIDEVEDTYHDNPYHNRIHAADVLHSTNYLINTTCLKDFLKPVEIMAVYFNFIYSVY